MKDRSLVLVVDPEPGRRLELTRLLEKHTLVVGVSTGEAALETTLLREPYVVVVALRVGTTSGLEVARALRGLPTMEDAAFVVFGPGGPGERWSHKAQKDAKKKHRVDHFLPGAVELRDVVTVAWTELKKRRQAEARLLRKAREGRVAGAEHSLGEVVDSPGGLEGLRVLLNDDGELAGDGRRDEVDPAEVDSMAWSDLLAGDLTMRNLRVAWLKFTRSGGPTSS